MNTVALSEGEYQKQRATGMLLCQCAGPPRRDPLFVLQCSYCAKRIDRRLDGDIPPTTTAPRRTSLTASK